MQEVIVQNFRAKPGTRMVSHPEPSLDDHLWTIAAARLLLGASWHVQAPPNLAFDEFPRLLDAGIDDWGGVSPVTIDHVNPEAPWPVVERLREATRSRGLELAARLPVYPEYLGERCGSTPRCGRPRCGWPMRWVSRARIAGRPASLVGATFVVRRDAAPLELAGDELGEEELTRLFEARGSERERLFAAADRLRREISGDDVSYVVTRNIQYTNVCYFRCGFCAFSKGKLARNLRGAPYLVPLAEIVRRCEEAWERGATEVCLQGGIHPASRVTTTQTSSRRSRLRCPASTFMRSPRSRSGREPRRSTSRSRTTWRVCATSGSARCRARRPRSSTTRCGR